MLIAIALSSVVAATALAASSPAVTTGGVSGRHSTSATLNGTVNPNGSATNYFFQWGTTTGYGAVSSTHSAGSGTSPVAVHTTASSLAPGTTYHYRLVASNGAGTTMGADRTFTTTGHPPPDVITGPASSLTSSSAVVSGTINPHGAATSWTVQYGTSPAYGVETFSGSLPAGNSPVNVSTTLGGLHPGTVFHYRFVARRSSTVVSYGADQQFMTSRRSGRRRGAREHDAAAKAQPAVRLHHHRRVSPPAWIPDSTPAPARSGSLVPRRPGQSKPSGPAAAQLHLRRPDGVPAPLDALP